MTTSSFCCCPSDKATRRLSCDCGQPWDPFMVDTRPEWTFSKDRKTESVRVLDGGRTVLFHPTISNGTAVCCSSKTLAPNRHHFWEVRVNSAVFGSDVVVGVAADTLCYDAQSHGYAGLIGHEPDSWGYSYKGRLYDAGRVVSAGVPAWSQGSLLGLHLDMWRGVLHFYLNRRPIQVAIRGIPTSRGVFAVVSSTATRTEMALIGSRSFETDLGFECMKTLSTFSHSLLDDLPPGLARAAKSKYWLLVGRRRRNAPASLDVNKEKYELAGSSDEETRRRSSENSRRDKIPEDARESSEDSDDWESFRVKGPPLRKRTRRGDDSDNSSDFFEYSLVKQRKERKSGGFKSSKKEESTDSRQAVRSKRRTSGRVSRTVKVSSQNFNSCLNCP